MDIKLDDEKKTIIFKERYISEVEQIYDIMKETPELERKYKLVNCLGFEALNGKEPYMKYYTPKKGDTIIDVGAHVGVFTQEFAKLAGDTGKVIAVEPDYRALGMLTHNTADFNNVKIVPYSLWNEKDIIPFHFLSASGGVGVGSNVYSMPFWHPTRADTLDSILENLNIKTVDFIKMDIEGSEIQALKGMKKTLKHTNAIVIAAYHKIDNKSTKSFKQVLSILENAGFTTRLEQGHDGELVYGTR